VRRIDTLQHDYQTLEHNYAMLEGRDHRNTEQPSYTYEVIPPVTRMRAPNSIEHNYSVLQH